LLAGRSNRRGKGLKVLNALYSYTVGAMNDELLNSERRRQGRPTHHPSLLNTAAICKSMRRKT
jgi:hypothetical protein